jgi:hypothetical protein
MLPRARAGYGVQHRSQCGNPVKGNKAVGDFRLSEAELAGSTRFSSVLVASYALKYEEEIMLHRKGAALILAASLLLISPGQRAAGDVIPGGFVLVVELEIDSSQLETRRRLFGSSLDASG